MEKKAMATVAGPAIVGALMAAIKGKVFLGIWGEPPFILRMSLVRRVPQGDGHDQRWRFQQAIARQ